MLNPSSMRLEHERINGGDRQHDWRPLQRLLNNGILKGKTGLSRAVRTSVPAGITVRWCTDHFVKLAPLWQLELYFKIAGEGQSRLLSGCLL